MSKIKVSVICICCRPGYIDTKVDSLIHQTMRQNEWEFILVDDLFERRKERVAKYVSGRIKNFLHIPPRHIELGTAASGACNSGIIQARGELVYFTSDRVYLHPKCLERHWEIYRKYGSNIIISGPYIDAPTQYREDHVELTDDNAISILKEPLKEPFLNWPNEYPIDWRSQAIRSLPVNNSLFENRNNADQLNSGSWWWGGLNDSAALQALVAINGFDEAFDGRRGGLDGDCGVRLVAYGCRYLVDGEAPCIRLPGTTRKPDVISEEERHRRIREKRGNQRRVFAPNDYNLREERGKIGLTTKPAETFDTSVITMHAGPLELLKKCINTIKENTTMPYLQVIVADKPDDEVLEYLKSLSEDGAKVATNPELIGIDAANQGLRMAEGKYLCLVSNDVMLSPSAIEAMREVLERYPEFGWVALSSEYTGFFSGCSILTREAFDKVGFFDTQFLHGFNDDDYLRRIWKAGYKPHIVTGVRVSHKGDATTNLLYGAEEKTRRFLRSQDLFFKKYGQRETNWNALPKYQPSEGENQTYYNPIHTSHIHRVSWIRSKVTPRDTILEVGSAENPVWRGTSFKVTTLDKSIRSKEQCFPDVVGEAENLPFEANTFDIVAIGELLEHVPDPQTVLKEAIRVAKEKVIVTVPWEAAWPPELKPFWNPGHVRFYTPESFNEEMAKLGLPHRVEMIKKGGWAWLGAEIYCGGIPMTEQVKKLNIGSFTVMLPPPDWINIDIIDLSAYAKEHGFNFQQVDATRGFPFEDNSIDFINSSHLIEHLTVDEGVAFLKECWRVLKPNSIVRIGTPDINKLVDAYKAGEMGKFDNSQPDEYKRSPSQADKFWRIFTAGHKTCYDLPALRDSFKLAGFTEVYEPAYNKELDMFPELSLYGEAKKGTLSGIEQFLKEKSEGKITTSRPVEGIPEYWKDFATGDRMG